MKKRLSTKMATTTSTILPKAGSNVEVVTPQAGPIKRRRKLDFTESQRFKGKHFYLDLDGYKRAKDLAVELSSRGATIQKFMDKSVRYVITNKPQHLIDQAKSNKGSASNPTTPSTGGLSQILSPLSAASQSPHVDKKPSPQFNYFTRSRKILEMGMEKSPKNGFTDVLATASRWNIKIIYVNAVEKELKKLKPLSNKKEVQYKRPTPKYVRRLRPPFFKLEDKSRLYKPIIYEPVQWPYINMNCLPNVSPFDVKYTEAKPVKEKSNENNDDDTDDKCTSTNTSTYSCKEEDVVYEEKRPGFCEPCSVRYEDLMAHLKSDSHQKYANDESNFAKLDELISQCTSLDDFLAEARRHSRLSISPECDIGSPLVKSPVMKEAHISLQKITSPVPSSIIRQNNNQRKRVGFTPPAPDRIVAKKTKLDL